MCGVYRWVYFQSFLPDFRLSFLPTFFLPTVFPPPSNMASFPPLFGSSSAGKTKTWSVCVVERDGFGVIQTTHGYVGSKQTTTERVIETGKNLGKKNETTALEQAVKEAQSDWNKKTEREGYTAAAATILSPAFVVAPTAATAVAVGGAGAPPAAAVAAPAVAATVPRPMLAHSFDKRGKDIRFPAYSQRKLDGMRCLADTEGNLYSRNGKPLLQLDHIRADMRKMPPGTVLDGELYSDTLPFEVLVGLIKKKKATAEDVAKMAQIHLCVYDMITTAPYEARKASLEALFATPFAALRLLPTEECKTKEDLKGLHDLYVAEGYEGLILRNKTGLYAINHRSKDLQKYKEFLDEEFVVTGFTVGEGVEAGCVIWTCVTAEGKEFSCRPKGTHESRQEALKTAGGQLGKKLTVRFQEWTAEKKPRFPVGVAFRDYE